MGVEGEKKRGWRTAITRTEPGKIFIRGYKIEELMERLTFGEAVYLLFKGDLPSKSQGRLMEAILTTAIDYGIGAPSISVARIAASCGCSLSVSAAAGLNTFAGPYHGGAIEDCAKMLQEGVERMGKDRTPLIGVAEEIVKAYKDAGRRIPGFGHPVHRVRDPRAVKIIELAEKYKLAGDHIQLCQAIAQSIKTIMGKPLAMNVDAGLAAAILDLGFGWRMVHGFNAISRTAGLVAHAHEEIVREKPFRAVDLGEILYDGPGERELEKRGEA